MNEGNKIGLLRLMSKRKITILLSSILSVFSAVAALAPFVLIYLIMDKLILWVFEGIKPNNGQIIFWGWSCLGFVALWLLFLYVSIILSHLAAYRTLYELRIKIVNHLGVLPLGFFTKNESGKIKTLLTEDVERIELFIAHHFPDAVTGIVTPLLTLGVLAWFDWRLVLAMLVPLPFAFYSVYLSFGGKKSESLMNRYFNMYENMNSTMIEYVRGMPVVKVFNQSIDTFKRFKRNVNGFAEYAHDWNKKSAGPWGISNVLFSSSLFFILPFGIWFYMEGSLDLSTLFLFIILGTGWFEPMFKFVGIGPSIMKINEGMKRINELLVVEPLKDTNKKVDLKSYDIEFKNVSFSFDRQEVIKNVSVSVPENGLTAIVGPSGAGKTTIAQLIPRMWDVDKGEISIGGEDIRNIGFSHLMDLVGFVFQDVYIYTDTIFENIRMGRERVEKEDVVKAAKAARCHDMIMDLEHGYDTVIGEGGETHLSGGEKQRIGIARVFLKNAPILILDEATAYADPENEALIQRAFENLMKNKTVLVIAHRLPSIVNADQILVIDDGRIVNRGTHKELIEKKGLYGDMWKAYEETREWKIEN